MKKAVQFDVQLANKLARLESYNKHLYRPNTYLHKWWARRCGSTFRLIMKHLVTEEGLRDYYSAGGLEGKIVLDPMMGGGTTLHEAIRLGANCIGYDIDPIPILQTKASLAAADLPSVEQDFDYLFSALQAEMGPLFTTHCPDCGAPSPIRFTLYGQRRRCKCREILLVDSLVVYEDSNGRSISLCPVCHDPSAEEHSCSHPDSLRIPLIKVRGEGDCPRCGGQYEERVDLPFYQRYFPLAVRSDCPHHGSRFQRLRDIDLALLKQANDGRPDFSDDPSFTIQKGPKSSALRKKGVKNYSDLFTSRQLLYIDKSIQILSEMDLPSRLTLSLLISTSLDFNSALCGYKGAKTRRAGAIRHVFSHHAYSIPFTMLEANPIFPTTSSGSLLRLFNDRVRKAHHWALAPRERIIGKPRARFQIIEGECDRGTEVCDPIELKSGIRKFLVQQRSSESLDLPDGLVDFIITDPPYYDSVEYEDLSAFFRVWLSRMIGDGVDPAIDWDYQTNDESRIKNGGSEQDGRYVASMSRIFRECQKVLRKNEGRLVFSFHHWDPRAWSALATALRKARFRLQEFHIVHSENPTSVHIANMRSLTDDAILFLAPRGREVWQRWKRPTEVSYKNSAAFCQGCAALLGWMLDCELEESQMSEIWNQMLLAR